MTDQSDLDAAAKRAAQWDALRRALIVSTSLTAIFIAGIALWAVVQVIQHYT